MFRRAQVLGVALAMALAAWVGRPASAANLLDMDLYLWGPRYSGEMPRCEAGLDTIAWRFADKESGYWSSALTIVGFEQVRETAYRPWAPNAIPRRFCSAVALISDGIKRPVHYWIGEDTGFAGVTWNVEWCVVGLDRNMAYNPGCRMARP
jgi:hypothetical protein